MSIRKAKAADLPAVAAIYAEVHDAEEQGLTTTGWKRAIYPTAATAEQALRRGDLFIQEEDGQAVGTGIINRQQVDVYSRASWRFAARDEEVMVLHTLAIAPHAAHKGFGSAFVRFYEDYAARHGCKYLRIDTNERNLRARALYARLGYTEADIQPCTFNGLEGIRLVLLEKKL